MKRVVAAWLGAMVVSGACAAPADTVVDVARATVRMPAGEWISLSRHQVDAVKVNDQRSIPAEVLTLALVQGSRLHALVTITATAGGAGGFVQWPGDCKPTDAGLWAVRPSSANPDDMECAYASAPFPAEEMFSDETAWGKAARARGLRAPDEMVMASAEVGSRMGALMSVEVLADVDFAGAPGPLSATAAETLPSSVDDRHAAFALQLAQRVRDCIHSIRGRMDFPPITFISAAPPEVRIARVDP
ncbi:MAG TPA: hypothetical protein VFY73_10745 [Ideonella sp.]|uniref:hypothetical protein n=1 Tax=Ideonella sp. TaxID=1929293 RepID=UPI002E37A873|nr:hypothetical protein [Ideonella sp.]HEX5684497.1 hypothetical protein [Ideonella sp.]